MFWVTQNRSGYSLPTLPCRVGSLSEVGLPMFQSADMLYGSIIAICTACSILVWNIKKDGKSFNPTILLQFMEKSYGNQLFSMNQRKGLSNSYTFSI